MLFVDLPVDASMKIVQKCQYNIGTDKRSDFVCLLPESPLFHISRGWSITETD